MVLALLGLRTEDGEAAVVGEAMAQRHVHHFGLGPSRDMYNSCMVARCGAALRPAQAGDSTRTTHREIRPRLSCPS
jgi:hypothetical protein